MQPTNLKEELEGLHDDVGNLKVFVLLQGVCIVVLAISLGLIIGV